VSKSDKIQEYFQEYLAVSRAWHGLHSGMTLSQGLRKLLLITSQDLSPSLAKKARLLTREIIFGTSVSRSSQREVV
jgi:hypothetical protein